MIQWIRKKLVLRLTSLYHHFQLISYVGSKVSNSGRWRWWFYILLPCQKWYQLYAPPEKDPHRKANRGRWVTLNWGTAMFSSRIPRLNASLNTIYQQPTSPLLTHCNLLREVPVTLAETTLPVCGKSLHRKDWFAAAWAQQPHLSSSLFCLATHILCLPPFPSALQQILCASL